MDVTLFKQAAPSNVKRLRIELVALYALGNTHVLEQRDRERRGITHHSAGCEPPYSLFIALRMFGQGNVHAIGR
jgi:hypothetical protein